MAPDCKKMIHPFQKDPGISQQQRLPQDLLAGAATIDGRTLADLLDFFIQLSRHINYYDENLQISDWQPFFRKSLPFTVAAIVKYDRGATEKKLLEYKSRFDRKPSAAGLELLLGFTYNSIIKKIDSWQRQVSGSDLPLQAAIDQLIKDKLSTPLKQFIKLANSGTTWFCTKNFGFAVLANNPVWLLTNSDLAAQYEGFKHTGNTKRKRLIALYNNVFKLVQSFLEVIRILGVSGEQSLEQSLLPLKEELKEKHPPHLAILFAFLKLFQYLQGDLNSYTRKHLDFFYKQVLLLKPKPAVPDKVHMVFEIQKQLDKYLLKKGLLLKDGKDSNKAEIYFATEDEIVVNKTQVADQRTLFLNNLPIKRQESDKCHEMTVVEGVYVAPDATKANGVDKDFTEGLPARATLGDKWSKYADPENKFILPYPNARIGFVLASPVLLLNEGKREITIDLSCKLDDDYCQTLIPLVGKSNPCCGNDDDKDSKFSEEQKGPKADSDNDHLPSLSASDLYNKVSAVLGQTYYYISRELIAEATKKGIGKETLNKLQELLTITHSKTDQDSGICYCPVEEKLYETIIPANYNWKPCRYYEQGEFVQYDGESYMCLTTHSPEINFISNQWDEIQLSAWDKTKTYKTGEIIIVKQGKNEAKYKSVTDIEKADEFDSSKWKPVEEIPLLCGKQYYREDMITYDGKVYVAKDTVTVSSTFDALKWKPASFTSKGFEEIFKEELVILQDIFKPRNALNIQFSGEKEWLVPLHSSLVSLVPGNMTSPGNFRIIISTQLKPEEAAVTFYNAEALKENIDTTLPVVKIELDDKIKLEIPLNTCKTPGNACCEKELDGDIRNVSLYHFFRNVKLLNTSKIDVQVCGLKNLIVQNDENVENVNSPIRAFGSRPKVGASFYIGSKELFSKNWQNVYLNTEWKDKPNDFGVHYKHYSYKDTIFEDGSKEIVHSSFLTTASVLDKGLWQVNGQRRLFKPIVGEKARDLVNKPLPPGFPPVPAKPEVPAAFCQHLAFTIQQDVYDYSTAAFPALSGYERRIDLLSPLVPYNVTSQYGFLKLTLEGVSFQQDIFPFVLTRQMMAYAGLLPLDIIQQMVTKASAARKIIDAMIIKIGNVNLHVGHIQADVGQLTSHINTLNTQLGFMSADLATALTHMPGNIPLAVTHVTAAIARFNNQITNALNNISGDRTDIQAELNLILPDLTNNPGGTFNPDNASNYGLIRLGGELNLIIDFFEKKLKVDPELKDGLPNEPYTPIIKSLSLDYTATADINDIDLIHLYPFAGTYKLESLAQQPMLFPTFCDEGNFYIGLKDLVPGSNVNILFQLAEATADAESSREELIWYYLENNTWKLLRTGFEVLNDDTNGLTTSGIIKFMLPANMTSENTILPKGLHWIKATIPQKSKSVSEIIGIHTQAIKAVFTNEDVNDKLRLTAPLSAGSVGKLKEADANVKKIAQPYDGFGGREPEAEKHFYVRASELLRHKNRAIQKFDYERIVLEAFPQIFKAKCINHTYALDGSKYYNDFLMAPGYVMIAVIPDLNQLKAAQCFEPRAPVSILENIAETLKKLTSPFVRLWIKNPRYEKVNFCLKIKLMPAKDVVYYKEKLKQDIKEFLAPWAVGEYEKLAFGQSISRSDMIRFLETRDYLDYIIELSMIHADDNAAIKLSGDKEEIIPITPRSILIAGTIDVCIDQKDCESWCECKNDAEGVNIPCCDHKKIPIMEYCKQ